MLKTSTKNTDNRWSKISLVSLTENLNFQNMDLTTVSREITADRLFYELGQRVFHCQNRYEPIKRR